MMSGKIYCFFKIILIKAVIMAECVCRNQNDKTDKMKTKISKTHVKNTTT